VLEVRDIHFAYDREILSNVNFNLGKGKFLGIVGKSGGGKTSLLKIIGGHLSPSNGEVHFNGKKLKKANELLVPGYENIALVLQDFGLNLHHTVLDNIRESVLHLPFKLQEKLIQEMLDLLHLHELIQQKAIHLSGGEQQRLSIARALASEADLVLLDEPFVHLDSPMRNRLILYLEKLKELRNTSFIIVTHNGEEVLGLCDEVLYFKKGQIKRKAKPEEFYSKPRSIEEAEFFGLVNLVIAGDKRKLFRPDQYDASPNNGVKLIVQFLRSRKQGPQYYNYFRTERGESILLFGSYSMEKINSIYV